MSRTSQNSVMMNAVLVPRMFSVRHTGSWEEGPSLIFILDGREQRKPLREIFNIHWEDIDIRMRDVDECLRDETAVDSRPRRSLNVKVIHNLTLSPEGMMVRLTVATMYNDRNEPFYVMPDLDKEGQQKRDAKDRPMFVPAKLAFERLFPAELLQELCNKANAFVRAMESYKLALWAKEKGDEKTFKEMGHSLDCFREVLSGYFNSELTVPMSEAVATKPTKPKKGKRGGKADVSTETNVAPTEAPAEEVVVADAGSDPAADAASDPEAPTPAPVAITPPKKDKASRSTPVKKLTLADLGSLKEGLPEGQTDGSNGQ